MRALPGRAQRRPHDRGRRRGVQAPARAERRPLPLGHAGHRQRRRRRPRGAHRRARHARDEGHRQPARAPVGQRAPDHAVPPGARPRDRALPRARTSSAPPSAASAPRTPTRRCASACASRTCSTRRSSARSSTSCSARRTACSPRSTTGFPIDAEEIGEGVPRARRRGSAPLDRRHRPPRARSARRAAVGAVRGGAGDVPRPRPRHLSVRHVEQPGRRRRLRAAPVSARRDRAHRRDREGVHRRASAPAVPDRAVRGRRGRRPAGRARRRVRHQHRAPPPRRLARRGDAEARDPPQHLHRARDRPSSTCSRRSTS